MAAVDDAGATCDPQLKTAGSCDRLTGLVCNTVSKQCTPLVYAGAGQACGPNVDDQFAACAAAASCLATGSDASPTETCVAAVADGADCDLATGPSCLEPARCILSSDAGTTGTCQFPNPLQCQ